MSKEQTQPGLKKHEGRMPATAILTKETILKAAIEKAVKNGWVGYSGKPRDPIDLNVDIRCTYYRHIFSHDFAKAFWGEERTEPDIANGECLGCRKYVNEDHVCRDAMFVWQYHLQQLVLEKDPLEYISKFI